MDIVLGCCLAIGVSWLILPWYASDEHLSQLAAAYVGAGRLVEKYYNKFHAMGKAAAEVYLPSSLSQKLAMGGMREGTCVCAERYSSGEVR